MIEDKANLHNLYEVRNDSGGDEIQSPNSWETVSRLIGLVANIAVVLVAALAYLQYADANEAVKRNRSMDYVNEWTEQGYTERYSKLVGFVEFKRRSGDVLPPGLAPEALSLAQANLGRKWVSEITTSLEPEILALEDEVDRIIQFFSRMEICVKAGLCAEDILFAYFESELTSFWAYFVVYAEERRQAGYSSYGVKVGDLTERFLSR